MIHLLILAVHLLATIAKLVRPGGVRAVVAESLLLKQQLLIIVARDDVHRTSIRSIGSPWVLDHCSYRHAEP